MLKLRLINGPREGRQLRVSDTKPVSIGRRKGRLRLHDSRVSKRHAQIRFEDGTWLIRDIGSSNGTYVNHARAEGDTPINTGDLIQIGRVLVKVLRADEVGMTPLPGDDAGQDSCEDSGEGSGAGAIAAVEAVSDTDEGAGEPSVGDALGSVDELTSADDLDVDDQTGGDINEPFALGEEVLSPVFEDEDEQDDAGGGSGHSLLKLPDDSVPAFDAGDEGAGSASSAGSVPGDEHPDADADLISLDDDNDQPTEPPKQPTPGTTAIAAIRDEPAAPQAAPEPADAAEGYAAPAGDAAADSAADDTGTQDPDTEDDDDADQPEVVGLSLNYAPPQQPGVADEVEDELADRVEQEPEAEAHAQAQDDPTPDAAPEPEPIAQPEQAPAQSGYDPEADTPASEEDPATRSAFDIDAAFDQLSDGLDEAIELPADQSPAAPDEPPTSPASPQPPPTPGNERDNKNENKPPVSDGLSGTQLDVGFIQDALARLGRADDKPKPQQSNRDADRRS